MTTGKKNKNNLSKRKLEVAVYVILIIAALISIFFIVKLIKNKGKTDETSEPSLSSLASLSSQDSSLISVETDSFNESNQTDLTSSADSHSNVEVNSEAAFAPTNSSFSSVSSSSNHSSSNKLSSGDYIDYTKSGTDEISEWYLRLVNANNLLQDSWRPTDLTTIDNDGRQIYTPVYGAYKDLVTAAKAAGITLTPISAYRSYATQNNLFQNRVNRALSDNPNFTRIEAENEAARHVARPNTSDHELGLAVDFNSVETSFENTTAGKWLKANCTDYGFVLRYAEDKQNITMVSYEPWHFRFVGVKHAKKMQELNMCLEEYIEYLK